jgi:hypothetical protein
VTTYRDLAAETRLVCADAVDELELAATLETHGVSDADAATRYGEPDVFALAGRLLRDRSPHRAPPEPQPSPWPAPGGRQALRGLLFALPALGYLPVAGLVTGRAAVLLLAGSLVAAWAAGQAVAYLGHVRLGRADPDGARGVLRSAAAVSVAMLSAATLALALAWSVPVGAALVAVGQVVYLLAATIPLVLGAERLLAFALFPATSAVLAGLATGGDAVRSAPVVAAVCLSLLATVAVAVRATRAVPVVVPGSGELIAALPYAAFGSCAASLVLFLPVAGNRMSPAVAFAAMVPLSLSMGLAEWLLVHMRIGNHRRLQQTTTIEQFARRARLALVWAVISYTVALAAGCALAALLVLRTTGVVPPAEDLVAYLPLGTALFLALLLLAYGLRRPVVAACATAVGAELVLLAGPVDADVVQLVVTGVLCAALSWAALSVLGRATPHR